LSGLSGIEIHRQLKHPVVDCDGHWLESQPVLIEYLRDIGGPALTDKYVNRNRENGSRPLWYELSDAERIRKRIRRPVWFTYSSYALDNATFRLPKLFYERLDEIGLDFSIVYPTAGLSLEGERDPELRGALIRAYNTMAADLFRPYADRLTPVAVVPRRTPQEAIDELTYAVRELGFKVVMINGTVHRRSESNERYVDALGLDNEEDYDPLWQACVDLGVAVTSHAGSSTWSDRTSVTNYSFNHIGHFAQANHVLAKAIFLGGVTNRFPALNFAFLEGGTGWARNLYSDLIGHFEKRTYEASMRLRNPAALDLREMRRLLEQYGEGAMKGKADAIIASIDGPEGGLLQKLFEREKEHIHEFGAAGVETKDQLTDLFTRRFYFGCEADDPMTAVAFDPRFGKPLKAVFSSDISHFDVPNVLDVLPEAYELLEHEMITEDDFRDFMFANAVRLHGEMNPDFFKGTVVEEAAAAVLAKSAQGAPR
jgi:predicted TIM-barrel fold metal-dependent hydrolase